MLSIFLRFGKFPPQFCESCGANYRLNYETFRSLWSTPNSLTADENNVYIYMHNWRRYPSSNW